ncbi:hypothetical protein [Streptomyces adelaidensis]|uniref:hypothetical protein n=1 Tax=Streptomyces adelaidensis TaxID=2796465 RepID=UPI00190654DE|nr:hypothetical protein [Streptomyces adelaidensis]
MEADLLPDPRRAEAFLATIRLAPAQADSVERPYDRQEGRAFPALLERLTPCLPAPASPSHLPGHGFEQAQAGPTTTVSWPLSTELRDRLEQARRDQKKENPS